MTRRKSFVLAILTLALLVSGCGKKEADPAQDYEQAAVKAETDSTGEEMEDAVGTEVDRAGEGMEDRPDTDMDGDGGFRFIANQSLEGSPDGALEGLEEEIRYGETEEEFQVMLGRFEMAFGEEEEERPCESLVFLDGVEGDSYIFGHYYVFYDDNGVYATQMKGRYQVNRHTGEVSAW